MARGYATIVVFFAVASPCFAVDRFWGNASGGTFNTAANWQGGVVPGTGDIARFGLTPTGGSTQAYLVNFSNHVVNQAIKVEDDLVTFNLATQSGSFSFHLTYSTSLATGNEIGNVAGRTGQLAITNGTFNTSISSQISIGVNSTSNGRLYIGAGSRLTGPPVMLVGNSGNGTLEVNGIANTDTTFVANNAGSTGTLIVSGVGAFTGVDDLVVGNGGSGTMIISNGGTLASSGALPTLGQLSTSNGVVNVTGTGSQWSILSDLTVGSLGNATMNITAGGFVQGTSAFIGRSSGIRTATVTVDGAGSRWINSGTISVGKLGTSTLLISGGGTVQSNGAIVGDGASGNVRAFVDGTGSRWVNNGSMVIGGTSGTVSVPVRFDITDGGVVQSNAATIGLGGVASVSLDGIGSQWNSATLNVGVGANGTLEISGGGALNSTAILSLGNTVSGGSGFVSVQGTDSSLTTQDRIQISAGSLNITSGATVNSAGGQVGQSGSNQSILVSGAGSKWLNSEDLLIDSTSGAVMNILAGGLVQNVDAAISSINEGMVNVGGTGSTWINDGNLHVGGTALSGPGTGTLNVNVGGLVTVGDTLTINHNGTINLNGGTIQAGQIAFDGSTFNFNAGTLRLTGPLAVTLDQVVMGKLFGSGHRIGPLQNFAVDTQATLATSLILDGGTFSVRSVSNSSLLSLQRGTFNLTNQNVTIQSGGFFGSSLDLPSDLTINVGLGILNRGLVRGDGQIGGGNFQNFTDGELRAEPGKSLTLTSTATNQGRISLLGGVLEFTQTLNNFSGVISGNGTLIVKEGLTNAASMTFSGHADVRADVANSATGRILVTGGQPTTFFEDVVNDGEIRTSLASVSVFLGNVTGAGSFSGPGTKLFEAASAATLASIITPGDTIVESTASLSAQLVRENELTVRGNAVLQPGNPVSRVNTLIIEETGALDLTDNALIVDATALGELKAFIAAGFNGGDWLGNGLTSSQAAAVAADGGDPHKTALGYAAAASLGITSFQGQSVSGANVVIDYVWFGDSNLDGKVNTLDFNNLAGSFGNGSNNFWINGDFDYDGIVDSIDYNLLVGNYGQIIAPPAPGLGAIVPEPASMAVLLSTSCLWRRFRSIN